MKRDLKLEIFLKKSKLMQEVWDNLTKHKTATEIAQELKKHRSSVSRVFLNMEKEGFIRCINPEDKSFRHYIKK